MNDRQHGSYEVVDGQPTVWVRIGDPEGPLVPVRRKRCALATDAAAPAKPAIHDCRDLPIGSKISILFNDKNRCPDVVIATIQRAREPDGSDVRDMLATSGGTLRWCDDDVSWWPRLLPGQEIDHLRAFDVVSVSPYPA